MSAPTRCLREARLGPSAGLTLSQSRVNPTGAREARFGSRKYIHRFPSDKLRQ